MPSHALWPGSETYIVAKAKRVAKKNVASVEHTDRKIARIAGSKHDTTAIKTLGIVSDVADQPPLIALSTATIAVGLFLGNHRLARTGARMLASHWIATVGKSLVKQRIDRTRPFVMLTGGSYHAQKGGSHAKQENSFPSGHTAGAVAVARAIAREYPEAGPAVYPAATAAAVAQLPRAAHFASDIIVGAVIGLIAEKLVALALPTSLDRS